MNEYLGGLDEFMAHWFRQWGRLVVLSGCGFREQEQPWRVWMFSLQTMRVRRSFRKLQLCVREQTGEQLAVVVQEVASCGFSFPSQQTDNVKQNALWDVTRVTDTHGQVSEGLAPPTEPCFSVIWRRWRSFSANRKWKWRWVESKKLLAIQWRLWPWSETAPLQGAFG